ncbi:hypothetical protein [Psychroserpens algicola]|uniref:Sensor histidine kinase n=1 Tax=Psychroserpens algicola TaxID=1719034 RepID=A0ABT0H5X7_9FLAO|nr:hypothetical protein [Psychroserpens algicola]MCK8479780.1 hypothetical protein [Psychroserpens algicola]
MELKKKGLLRQITFEVIIVLFMAVIIHYVLNDVTNEYEIFKIKFPKSLGIALFFRLSFINLSSINS